VDKLILFDFECDDCGKTFEELTDPSSPEPVKCLSCGQFRTRRLISTPRFDPKMGIDSAFSTMGDKWVKKRRQHQKIEEARHREHGD
jgi:putative FmdB family regulatory protein